MSNEIRRALSVVARQIFASYQRRGAIPKSSTWETAVARSRRVYLREAKAILRALIDSAVAAGAEVTR